MSIDALNGLPKVSVYVDESSKASVASPEEQSLGKFEESTPIDVSEGNAQQAQQIQENEDRLKHRRGVRNPGKVIADLELANRALNERLEYDNLFYKQELAKANAEIHSHKNHHADLEADSLKTKENLLVKALADAKAEGDFDREAKIQNALSALHTDLSVMDMQRHRVPQGSDGSHIFSRYNPPPPPRPDQAPAYRSEYVDWLTNNPWFASDSPNYNADLAGEVIDYAKELNKHMQVNGLGHKIDSREYYQVLDDIIGKKYKLDHDSDRSRPAQNGYTPQVAAVRHTDARHDSSSRRSVYLDAEQRELALSRKKNHANGVPYTENELLQHHVNLMEKVNDLENQSKIRSSPHKMTMTF